MSILWAIFLTVVMLLSNIIVIVLLPIAGIATLISGLLRGYWLTDKWRGFYDAGRDAWSSYIGFLKDYF